MKPRSSYQTVAHEALLEFLNQTRGSDQDLQVCSKIFHQLSDGEVLKPFSKNIEPDSEEIISAIESLL